MIDNVDKGMPVEDVTQREQALMFTWMKGNEDAANFCIQFIAIIHLWDDLVDKDVERSEKEINEVFRMLFDLPMNPFYHKFYFELNPVITTAINSWVAANKMEREQCGTDLHVAYTLRCEVLNVIVHCAQIIGGNEWAESIGVEIWRYGMRESFSDYQDDIKQRSIDNA